MDSLPPAPFYSASSYYHADGNGNVTALINASQTVVAKYLYDSFGNLLAQSGSLANANAYRFSSKEWNANSALYYYLYRFYDPNFQRWLNRDLFGELGFEVVRHLYDSRQHPLGKLQKFGEIKGTPDLYEFVLNSPIDRLDLLGLRLADNSCGCADAAADCINDQNNEKGVEPPIGEEPPEILTGFLLGILGKLTVGTADCYGRYLACIYKCNHPPLPCPNNPPPIQPGQPPPYSGPKGPPYSGPNPGWP